jgi:DNA-directed RNA polymerase specialized sigma24 family protein
MSAKDPGRGLSAEGFANLLTRLGPDAERAVFSYENLHRALVSFFAWKGAATPEECADETLDRLASRLDEGVAVENPARFARGIARIVLLEHWRRPEARSMPLDDVASSQAVAEAAPDDDALGACLDRCLAALPPGSQELIREYYLCDGRARIETRKRIARELGVSESALRNRAQRVRDQLERCMKDCLGAPLGRAAGRGDTKA